MDQTFIIPAKADSWNVLARKHYRVYMTVCQYWHLMTQQAIRNTKIKAVKKFPCQLKIHCKFKTNKSRDIDSIFAKAMVDTLVSEGILPDDNLKYLNGVNYTGELGTQEKDVIEVTIIQQN